MEMTREGAAGGPGGPVPDQTVTGVFSLWYGDQLNSSCDEKFPEFGTLDLSRLVGKEFLGIHADSRHEC